MCMYEGTSKIYFGAKYFDIYSHEGFFKKFMEMDVMKNLSINFKMFLYQNKHMAWAWCCGAAG